MWGGRSSRQRGREHGDSVITSTLPDTAAVRLMLDSYPPPPPPLPPPPRPSLHSPRSVSHTVYLPSLVQKLELSGSERAALVLLRLLKTG